MSLDALARTANFRDLGGHVGSDGRQVVSGQLFRSGELSKLSRAERAALAGLGLRTILDLRTDAEVEKRGPTPAPSGTRVVRLPIDSGDLTSQLVPILLRGRFRDVRGDLLQQVNRELARGARTQLRAAVALIADPQARPLLFHCTHGKDRTGLLAMLVLSALDVPWPLVLADYVLSNERRTAENRRQYRLVRFFAPMLARRPIRRPELDAVKRLFFVVPENLLAARDEMESSHGSVDAYLADALGLIEPRRALLRAQLLVDAT